MGPPAILQYASLISRLFQIGKAAGIFEIKCSITMIRQPLAGFSYEFVTGLLALRTLHSTVSAYVPAVLVTHVPAQGLCQVREVPIRLDQYRVLADDVLKIARYALVDRRKLVRTVMLLK
jgi:hypothetical protein